jgi:hypothetical protein
VKDLAVRLAALDADAGAALRVIAYFDSLTESRAGLQAIVRGAAVLAGCPARLADDERRVRVRVTADGSAEPSGTPPDAGWMRTGIGASAVLMLERTGEPGPVEAMILERAAGAARAVLDRTRGRLPAADPALLDPALVELIIDPAAPSDVRDGTAKRLGLTVGVPTRVVALASGPVLVPAGAPLPPGRAGVGPAVAPADLPRSWAAARLALRFTAAGTDEDPGETVVHHDDLGGLTLLADVSAEVPDVRALDHAAAAAPWLLTTLNAVATTSSLRAAAIRLRLHHSSLQDRVVQAEHLLGWPIREPQGKLRVQLALTLRRLRR